MSAQKQIAVSSSEGQSPERVSQRPVTMPPVDIYENEDELLVVADMPGVTQDRLNLHFDQSQLFIEGSAPEVEKGRTVLFREFGPTDFKRVFELAPGIEVGKISAELKEGTLTIHLPKAATLKPRKIAVTSG